MTEESVVDNYDVVEVAEPVESQPEQKMESVELEPKAPEKQEKELSFKDELRKNLKKDTKEPAKPVTEKLESKVKEQKTDNTPAPTLMPADMDKEEQEAWKGANPKLQNYLSRRAYDMRKELGNAYRQVAQKSQEYQGIDKVIAEHKSYLDKMSVTPVDALRRSIAWEKAIKENPVQGAKQYLAAFGIDPYSLIEDDVLDGTPEPQQTESVDPAQIKQEIWNELNQQFEMQRQSQTVEKNYSIVNSWMKDKPLFQDPATASQLEADMAPIVKSIRGSNPQATEEQVLDTAYNYVTKGNDRYAQLLTAWDQRKVAQKNAEKAIQAKQSSRSISGGLQGAAPVKGGLNFRDELRLRMQGGM